MSFNLLALFSMDFDFGTVIYVVLAIIYFIIQSGAKRKKQQQKQTPQDKSEYDRPQPTRRPTFEELLEEFTGQKQVQPQPVVEVLEEKKEPKAFFEVKPRQSTYEAAQKRAEERKRQAEREAAKIRSRFNEHFEPFEVEEEAEASDYASMFRDLDSAKKAFVASEIFKRKYN